MGRIQVKVEASRQKEARETQVEIQFQLEGEDVEDDRTEKEFESEKLQGTTEGHVSAESKH